MTSAHSTLTHSDQEKSAAISFENVFFRYARNQANTLEDISFTLRAGESMTIIGPNGGGKTTCLMLLIGKLRQQQGRIHVFGKPLPQKKPLISGVFQKSSLAVTSFPISLHEFAALWGLEVPRKDRHHRAEACLTRVGLLSQAHKPISALSSGQLQRALIAGALMGDSPIMIFDEPTSNLDEESEEQFYTLLKELRTEGKTLILVSHDISVAPKFSDKTLCINRTHHEITDHARGKKSWEQFYSKELSPTGHSHLKAKF